jgi:PKD repeat protein
MMHRKLLIALALLLSLLAGVILPACDDLVTEITEVTVYGPPEAEFDANVDVGCGDSLRVTFRDESNGFGIVEWLWIFNANLPDSEQDSSSEQDPTFVYHESGFYDVRLVVTDSLGQTDGELKTRFIWLSEPVAAFDIKPGKVGCPDTRFELINKSEGITQEFTWYIVSDDSSYIDSTYRTNPDLFLPVGTYAVTLVADGGDTCGVDTSVDTITVGDCPQFTFSFNGISIPDRDTVCALDPVTVTYVDSGGPIDSVVVVWAKNTQLITIDKTLTGAITDTPYEAFGLYTVQVIAAGPGGADTAELTNIVQVYEPLKASIIRNVTSDTLPFPATVIYSGVVASGSNAYDAVFQWQFSDDAGAIFSQNPGSHTFDTAGTYFVTLTAFNNCNVSNPSVVEDTFIVIDTTPAR